MRKDEGSGGNGVLWLVMVFPILLLRQVLESIMRGIGLWTSLFLMLWMRSPHEDLIKPGFMS